MSAIEWIAFSCLWAFACVAGAWAWRRVPRFQPGNEPGTEFCAGALIALIATQFVGLATVLAEGVYQAWFARQAVLAVIGIAMIVAARRMVSHDVLGLTTPTRKSAAVLGAAVWFFLLPANLGIHAWAKGFLEDPEELQGSMRSFLDVIDQGAAEIYLPMTLILVVMVPLIEEVLFRGWLQNGLRGALTESIGQRPARILAVALSTAVFVGVHPPFTWIPIAFLGLILGLLFERTGSLWAGVAFHGLHNLFTLYYPVWQS